MFTELRTLLQRAIHPEGFFSQNKRSPESQGSADISEDPRIDNRAARRLFQEQIDFNYKTSLRSSQEVTLAGYGGEFPGGRMHVTAVWGSLSDKKINLIAELEQRDLLPHLGRIEVFDGRAMTDEGLSLIGSIRSLRRLQIVDAPQITDRGVQALLKSLSRLESLELTLEQCTDAAFNVEVCFQEMTEIDVSYTQLTDSGLLGLISKAPNLKRMDVTGTSVTGRVVSQARIAGLEIVV